MSQDDQSLGHRLNNGQVDSLDDSSFVVVQSNGQEPSSKDYYDHPSAALPPANGVNGIASQPQLGQNDYVPFAAESGGQSGPVITGEMIGQVEKMAIENARLKDDIRQINSQLRDQMQEMQRFREAKLRSSQSEAKLEQELQDTKDHVLRIVTQKSQMEAELERLKQENGNLRRRLVDADNPANHFRPVESGAQSESELKRLNTILHQNLSNTRKELSECQAELKRHKDLVQKKDEELERMSQHHCQPVMAEQGQVTSESSPVQSSDWQHRGDGPDGQLEAARFVPFGPPHRPFSTSQPTDSGSHSSGSRPSSSHYSRNSGQQSLKHSGSQGYSPSQHRKSGVIVDFIRQEAPSHKESANSRQLSDVQNSDQHVEFEKRLKQKEHEREQAEEQLRQEMLRMETEMSQKLRRLQEETQRLQLELLDKDNELRRQVQSNVEKESQISSLKATIEDLNRQLLAKERENDYFRQSEQLKHLENECSMLKGRLLHVEEHSKQKDRSIERIRQQMEQRQEAMEKEKNATIQKLEGELQQSSPAPSMSTSSGQQVDIQALRARVQELEMKLSTKEQELNSKEADLTLRLKTLEDECYASKKAAVDLQDAMSKKSVEMSENEGRIQFLVSQLKAARQQEVALKQEKNQAAQEVEQVQEMNTELRSSLDDVKGQLLEAQQLLEENKAMADKAQEPGGEVATLTEKLANTERHLQTALKRHADYRQTIEDRKHDLLRVQKELKVANDALAEEKQRSSQELSRLRTEKTISERKLGEVEQQLKKVEEVQKESAEKFQREHELYIIMSNDLQTAQQQVQRLEADKANMVVRQQQAGEQYQQDFRDLEAKVFHYQQTVAQFSAERQEQNDFVRQLSKQHHTLVQQHTDLQQECKSLQEEYRQKDIAHTNLLARYETLSQTVKRLKSEQDQLNSQKLAEAMTFQDEVRARQDSNTRLQREVAVLKGEKAELEAYKVQCDVFKADFEGEKRSRECLMAEKEKLKSENERLEEECSRLTDDIRNLQLDEMRRRHGGGAGGGYYADRGYGNAPRPEDLPPPMNRRAPASRFSGNDGGYEISHGGHKNPSAFVRQQLGEEQQRRQIQNERFLREQEDAYRGFQQQGPQISQGQHTFRAPVGQNTQGGIAARPPRLELPVYRCPRCDRDFPDLESLQIHVVDCLEK